MSTPVRYQGKITDWKDDRGFGFVVPNCGGPKVFVHIKSFSNRNRRPVGNELVTYELTSDAQGRPQGVNIVFAGDHPSYPATIAVSGQKSVHPLPARNHGRTPAAPGPGVKPLIFATVFLAFVAGAVATGKLPFAVLAAYLVGSCVAYVAYGFDKFAAHNGLWRTQESTLHLLSMVGGWPGAMLAQRTLRHKTKKESFQAAYWATVVLNCAALGLLLWPTGMHTVKSFLMSLQR